MATGDITISVNPDGWSDTISVAGFTSAATYDFDWRAQVPGTFISGAFTNNEVVKQNGTNVTGRAVGAQSSGAVLLIKTIDTSGLAVSDGLNKTPQSAATNASDSYWVGQSSGAQFKPSGGAVVAIPGPNTPYHTVVSKGFDITGAATTITRIVYLTASILDPYSAASIPGTVFSGTLVDGEIVDASVSGRTAIVVGNQGSGALLLVKKVSGATNAADVWTGRISGKTFAATATHSTLTLPKNNELAPTAGLVFYAAQSDYIYLKDNTGGGNSGTAPTFTAPAGFVVNSGGGGASSNVASAIAVTQNSTQGFPNVIIQGFTIPYRLLSGAFTTEVQAFHRHAMNNKPLACIIATYADGTVTRVQSPVTAMSKSTDADRLPVYAFPEDATNFTQSANMTCKYVAYPWVGDNPFDSSVNTWQNAGFKFSNLPVGVCDKGGTYGQSYCAFDPVGGSDSNTTAYSTQAAAEAGSKTLTMGKALANCKAYNLATYGRDTVDGANAIMMAGSTLYGEGSNSMGTNTAVAANITKASTITRAQAVITGYNATSRYGPTVTRLYDISVVASDASNQLFAFVHNNTSPLIMENCSLTGVDSNTAPVDGDADAKGTLILKNSTVSHYGAGINGSASGWTLWARGVTVDNVGSGQYAFRSARSVTGSTMNCGGADNGFTTIGAALTGATEVGNRIYSYNKFLASNGIFVTGTPGSATNIDCAFVGNVMERVSTTGSPLIELSAASITNLILWHNSAPGDRVNTEGDITGGAGTGTDYIYALNSFKYNAWYYNGTHSQGDVHAFNALLTGQWPYSQYNVGRVGNISEIRDTESYSFLGRYSKNQSIIGYKGDLSKRGTVSIPVNSGTWSGTFLDGEAVTQLTSGAIGFVVSAQSSGSVLVLRLVSDGSDNTHQWKGNTSAATVTATAVAPTGTGNGDYHLTDASQAIAMIPSGEAVIPYDIDGVAIPNDGTGAAGAYQFVQSAGSLGFWRT